MFDNNDFFYCCVMYSGVECIVCCYSECISHTRQAEIAGSIPTVVRLIFQLAWCGIYTQSNNTLYNNDLFYFHQILFGGASAGGIGMLSNIDHVAKMVRPARLLGYNDGGWFTLYRNFLEPQGSRAPEFLTTLRYVRMICIYR